MTRPRRNEPRHVRPCRSKTNQQSSYRSLFGSINLLRESRWGSAGRGAIGSLKVSMQIKDLHRTQETQDTETLRSQRHRELKDTQDTHDRPVAPNVTTVRQAVDASLKDGIDNNVLFRFARYLKAFEVFHNRRLKESELDAAFSEWWAVAQVKGESFGMWEASFMESFKKARVPVGVNLLEQAKAAAVKVPPIADGFDEPIAKLISVCWHLNRLNDGAGFFLGVRDAAKILGTSQLFMASAVLSMLVSRGVIEHVEKGTRQKAARYKLP